VDVPDTASPPRSLAELRALAAAGGRVKYLFFWGHQPQPDDSIGPGCLSQWWPAPFVVDGIRYATAEHYMMIGKARLFGDEAIAAQMLTASHPGAVKALGRQVRDFDQAVWDAHCFDLVVAGGPQLFTRADKASQFAAGADVCGQKVAVDSGDTGYRSALASFNANVCAAAGKPPTEIGRDPNQLTVAQLINTSIEDDSATAVKADRWEVATTFKYPSTPKAKLSVGEPAIDPDDLPRFAAAFDRAGQAGLQEVLPEHYVTSLTATGTVADVRDRVAAYRQAGVELPLVRPAAPHQLDRLLATFASAEAK
jgi:ribA/ribD-fused uncharacterized protein